MDALALLCTLHADGPATLRILRQSGCASLERLGELGPERLAELLALTPAGARRFLREARNLRARLGDEMLEQEEAPPAAVAEAVPTAGASFAAPRARTAEALPVADASGPFLELAGELAEDLADELAAEPAAGATTGDATGALASNERVLMNKVLSAWRERDASEPVAIAVPQPEPTETNGSPETPGTREDDDGAEDAGLRPGELDGLTGEVCRRLRDAGVRTVDELLEVDVLELANATGLGFTLVQRLQFLGRRERGEAPARDDTRTVAAANPVPAASPVPAANRVSAAMGADRQAPSTERRAAAETTKISVDDTPEAAKAGWNYEILPRAGGNPERIPAPEPETSLELDAPPDAAGPFA